MSLVVLSFVMEEMMKESTRGKIVAVNDNVVSVKFGRDMSNESQRTVFYIPREGVAEILLDVFPEGITPSLANNR
ncbi:MAG TPA: hypothetical protein VJH33_00230 [Candidatus Paceibacterota bacterium]